MEPQESKRSIQNEILSSQLCWISIHTLIGIPVLLNTSFNDRDDPIADLLLDTERTFIARQAFLTRLALQPLVTRRQVAAIYDFIQGELDSKESFLMVGAAFKMLAILAVERV